VEQHYTWEAVADRWATLYRALISAPRLAPMPASDPDLPQDAVPLAQEASVR
jgi:hypothetical protein